MFARRPYPEVMRAFAGDAPEAVRTDRELPVDDMVSAKLDAWLGYAEQHRDTTIAMPGVEALGRDLELSGTRPTLCIK